MKTDITYFPDNQTVEGYRPAGNTETIRVAKNSLVYEFYTYTKSDQFKIIDFKTFVKIFASQYKDLALSFQLAIAEEEKESAVTKNDASSNDDVKIDQKHIGLPKDEGVANEVVPKQDTPYSGTAISDGQYDNEANTGCMDEIITQLKTYNWYVHTALSFKTTSIILVILRKTIIFAHSDAGSTASGVSFYRSYKIIFVGGNQMRQRPFFDFRLNFRYAKIRFILLICNILRA